MESNNQAIIDAMRRLQGFDSVLVTDPKTDQDYPLLLVPEGLKPLDPKPILDQWLDAPRRINGTSVAETLQSFCDLVMQHKTLNTVIFASKTGPGLEAIIDYHGRSDVGGGSTPQWCGHRIAYPFPKAPEFKKWEAASSWRSQGQFAAFLDERRFDIADPLDIEALPANSVLHEVLWRATPREKRGQLLEQLRAVFASPGDLMQLVESLSGHSKTKWAEVKTDRFGGMRATIEKEGRVEGDEKIPSLFLVDAAAFVGGDKITIPARIAAKVEAGLQLRAELIGLDRVLEMAFDAAIEEVKAKTSVPVFRGARES